MDPSRTCRSFRRRLTFQTARRWCAPLISALIFGELPLKPRFSAVLECSSHKKPFKRFSVVAGAEHRPEAAVLLRSRITSLLRDLAAPFRHSERSEESHNRSADNTNYLV